MASNNALYIAAEQPTEGGLDVLTMSNAEIKNQISATHAPPEKDFDANSLFVVVKQILEPSDNILQGQKDPENPVEGVPIDSFDPTLDTVEQLRLEVAHKALDVETAHKTSMSILNKLSSYSWQSKAVLALANFALDYKKYILATSQGDPATRVIESVEIPLYVSFYHKKEIKERINFMLITTERILDLEKQKSSSSNDAEDVSLLSHAMDDIPVVVYWIIMSVVACTTPVFCPTSNEDNTQELLSLATSIYENLLLESCNIRRCLYDIEDRKAMRRTKEFLQTPDEVTEVLKRLLFGKDDVQPLIDSCLDEPVSLDVLKDKGVLLFFSDMHVSRDDILIMKPVYEEITDYNIVWIPIVAQWTDELRKKFDMLRSQMPWYVLQYFSQLAGIKFIKEEWHFENGPVVVAMDARGNIQRKSLLPRIREEGTEAVLPLIREEGTEAVFFNLTFHQKKKTEAVLPHILEAFHPDVDMNACMLAGVVTHPLGPHTMEDYTFHCGGKDSRWMERFSEKVNAMAKDPIIKEALISVECSCVENVNTWNPFKKAPKRRKRNEEIQRILPSFKNEKRWAVLIKWSTKIVSDDGPTILKVLEMFDEWKQYVSERGFENCFRECHEKLRSTSPNPSTSQPV